VSQKGKNFFFFIFFLKILFEFFLSKSSGRMAKHLEPVGDLQDTRTNILPVTLKAAGPSVTLLLEEL